jgi:LAO/AO transport system kinase
MNQISVDTSINAKLLYLRLMADSAKRESAKRAVEQLRETARHSDPGALAQSLINGDRAALGRAITIIESGDEQIANQIITQCLPHSGKSIRMGITGVPGVGKSTFIDAFGMELLQAGKRVAVLAVDPSSPLSKGSILGDKTRMERLAADSRAFIRPSPSADTLGGVARKTRETILLCEAAGYDVILVETVGVGQSEIAVHGMTDFFVLLMLAGAGDQLQGIKRGIMEMCDAMIITKADGDNSRNATRAQADYASALHLFPARDDGWFPPVLTTSALEGSGLQEVFQLMQRYETWMQERGLKEERRKKQSLAWLHETLRNGIVDRFFQDPGNKAKLQSLEASVLSGELSPSAAAERLLGK